MWITEYILYISLSLMLNYLYSQVYTQEISHELSLGIVVLGCPLRCEGCHSPHVWDINCSNTGTRLTVQKLQSVLESQKWVSCILFYGGEWNMPYLTSLLQYCKELGYKTALYSGHSLEWFETNHPDYKLYLDYLKVGRYDSKYGSLNYPSTNQRLYKLDTNEDITHLFWKTNIK